LGGRENEQNIATAKTGQVPPELLIDLKNLGKT
jgi:hypothetical protein